MVAVAQRPTHCSNIIMYLNDSGFRARSRHTETPNLSTRRYWLVALVVMGFGFVRSVLFGLLCACANADSSEQVHDKYLSLSDSRLLAWSARDHTLMYSNSSGGSWVPVLNYTRRPAIFSEIYQSPYHSTVWGVDDMRQNIYMFDADGFNDPGLPFASGYSVASQHGNITSVLPHRHDPHIAIVNGDHEVVAGSFYHKMNTVSFGPVQIDHCAECSYASNMPSEALLFCRTDDEYEHPERLMIVNTTRGMSALTPVRMDGATVNSVKKIDSVNGHVFAQIDTDQGLRVITPKSVHGPWIDVTLPTRQLDALEFVENEKAQLAIAVMGNRRFLWTLNAINTEFTNRLELSPTAILKRVGRSLIVYDEQVAEISISVNNGRTWQKSEPSFIDISTLELSPRISAAFNPEHTQLVISLNGLDWDLKSLPVENKDSAEFLLIDQGSAILMREVREENSTKNVILHLSSDSGSTWTEFRDDRIDFRNDWAPVMSGKAVMFRNQEHSKEAHDALVIDLTQMLGNRSCTAADVEEIQSPRCLMGFKDRYWVRKRGTSCVMGSFGLSADPGKLCECGDGDYECSPGFIREDSKCVLGPDLKARLENCTEGETREQPQAYSLIPGNKCTGGKVLDADTYVDCKTGDLRISQGNEDDAVVSRTFEFKGKLHNYLYLPSSQSSGDDETVLAWTRDGELYVSSDQGSEWRKSSVSNVLNVFKSSTDDKQVFAVTADTGSERVVWVSWDRGETFEEVNLPAMPSITFGLSSNFLNFHPSHPEWMIYTGKTECDDIFTCPGASFVSKDKGKTWDKMLDKTSQCRWIHDLVEKTDENLVYCVQSQENGDNDESYLFWSEDYFKSEGHKVSGLEKVAHVVVEHPFVIALKYKEAGEPALYVTANGKSYTEMKQPLGSKLNMAQGGTIVSTKTQSIMIFETVDSQMEQEFGTLLKSNSNGTNLVPVLENVNRDGGPQAGYVDFDRVLSVEGVALANIVANADDVLKNGVAKKIRTVITHSDGALWGSLPAPDGMCPTGSKDCALHLHGYTERLDYRNTPSSPSAVGIIFGRGNVGDSLGDLRSSQTYMTRDAGLTWKKVSDRPMFWEFGDSGSILILIDSMEPTNTLKYSMNEGETWHTLTWETPIKVLNLATIPSDTSRKFIIFGEPPLKYGDINVAVQADFSKLIKTQCGDSDFELWTPQHPQTKSPCLFGHEAQYRRKKPGTACYVGKNYSDDRKMPGAPHKILKNCACTRSDFECDFNYRVDPIEGTCQLVPGTQPLDRDAQCANGASSWHRVTGYRKVPISTCEGGEALGGAEEACPGKVSDPKPPSPPSEQPPSGGDGNHNPKEDAKKTRHAGVIFFASLFGIVLCLIAYVVLYERFGPHSSGQIRLPDRNSAGEAFQGAAMISASGASKAWAYTVGLWNLASMHIPFLGSPSPRDHLGFYSRMDDDERYRILDDEDDFEDSEGDSQAPAIFEDTDSELYNASNDVEVADAASPSAVETESVTGHESGHNPFTDEI